MLEQSALLLEPWLVDGDGPAALRRRNVVLPATGQVLGFVRAGPSPGSTWGWLAKQTVQVFETEDASLLMTVRRPWGPGRAWTVFDADERRVGVVYRQTFLDSDGQRMAMARSGDAGHGCFLSPRGTELGSFESRDGSVILAFSDILEGKPFPRMILLGAVLSWG